MTYDEIFDNAEVDRSHAPDRFTWTDLRRVASYQARQLADEQDRSRSLLDALLTALPYVEMAEHDEAYKSGAVRKVVNTMRAAIEQATSERSD